MDVRDGEALRQQRLVLVGPEDDVLEATGGERGAQRPIAGAGADEQEREPRLVREQGDQLDHGLDGVGASEVARVADHEAEPQAARSGLSRAQAAGCARRRPSWGSP